MDSFLLQWFVAMHRSAKGRISLGNLRFDVRYARIHKDNLRQFFMALADELKNAKAPIYAPKVAQSIVDRSADQFLCKGPAVPSTKLSRIMNARTFVQRNLDRTKVPLITRSYVTDAQLRQLERLGIEGRTKGIIKGYRPLAWVTTTEAVDELRASGLSPTNLAVEVRNQAGLAHFRDREALVEIQYPNDGTVTPPLSVPTFLEGSPSRVFRCAQKPDGWGRAVNLETLEDGLPEAVHPPIPFVGNFHFVNIGRLNGTVPNYSYAAFEGKLQVPWDNTGLTEVQNYVK